MKKVLFFFVLILGFQSLHAQQFFLEVYSGVNATAYEPAQYEETQWHVPIGVRIAGDMNMSKSEQNTVKILRILLSKRISSGRNSTRPIQGLFLRGNISSLPAYRFGLILRAGAGYYETVQNNFILPSESLEQQFEFERQLGYNIGIGVSSPIYTVLHWEIGYQFNYVDRPESGFLTNSYNASYHSFQMGLSLNLVFGNTQKKCRRVIGGNRNKKGW